MKIYINDKIKTKKVCSSQDPFPSSSFLTRPKIAPGRPDDYTRERINGHDPS